jgi:hypothetical protein
MMVVSGPRVFGHVPLPLVTGDDVAARTYSIVVGKALRER